MNKFFFITIGCFLTLNVNALEVLNAKIKLLPPSSKTTVMFLTFKNDGNSDQKVLNVKSSISDDIELHNMIMENGMMKMRATNEILVPKNSSVELKPGGLHVMIFNLKAPLKENEQHEFSIELSNKEIIKFKALVIAL